jgi:hypothetical protein
VFTCLTEDEVEKQKIVFNKLGKEEENKLP